MDSMTRRVPKKERAPRGSLTPARIIEAGLAVLARAGIAGVGIRSVAQELGVAPMSLYRHVENHEALLLLLQRHVLTPPEGLPAEGGSWRQRLRALLHGARAQLRRYPRAVVFFHSENFHQPSASLAVEHALKCLSEAGLQEEQQAKISATLWMYTVGSVLAEQAECAAWPGEDIPLERRESWVSELTQKVGAVAPRVTSMAPRWSALNHEQVFHEGLELLLSGILLRAE
jgi:AcrR family transcriptional regulator